MVWEGHTDHAARVAGRARPAVPSWLLRSPAGRKRLAKLSPRRGVFVSDLRPAPRPILPDGYREHAWTELRGHLHLSHYGLSNRILSRPACWPVERSNRVFARRPAAHLYYYAHLWLAGDIRPPRSCEQCLA